MQGYEIATCCSRVIIFLIAEAKNLVWVDVKFFDTILTGMVSVEGAVERSLFH